MNRKLLIIILVILSAAIVWGASFVWRNSREADPTENQASQDSGEIPATETANDTGLPLSLPASFSISTFAKDLPSARVMVFDRFGNMWVSQSKEGTISTLEIKDGRVVRQSAVLRNLDNPHGLAIDPENGTTLYYAEEGKISRIALYSDDSGQKIADLPTGGRHTTRTLGFGPDGRLYVSIGSSCDVCNERDERRAAIYSLNKDGSDFRQVAKGLRNTVFFTWDEQGRMWGADMGRDFLGDNLPPDEINIIQAGKDYGWPICYGKNIHDTNFDKNQYIQNPCNGKVPSHVDLQAHSAPLGLAFVPTQGWPAEYQDDLIVAFHGSWNRSQPTGYKIVMVKLDSRGNHEATEDFITGWISQGARTALGRPADIKSGSDGAMYVSDDQAGVIYKVWYNGSG